MAKAAALDIDLNEPAHQPPAATAPRAVKEAPQKKKKAPTKNDTPVNFRWPADEVKALKVAAAAADMTMQDFLLSCFRARSKN